MLGMVSYYTPIYLPPDPDIDKCSMSADRLYLICAWTGVSNI